MPSFHALEMNPSWSGSLFYCEVSSLDLPFVFGVAVERLFSRKDHFQVGGNV